MANPFLMDDEEIPSSDPVSNPFLFGDDAQDDVNEFVNDNPFLGQATNPFAGFGEEDESSNPITTGVDIFGVSSMTVTSGADFFMSSNDDIVGTMTATPYNHPTSNTNFFDTTINDDDDLVIQKPTNLQLGHHHNSNLLDDPMNAYSSEEELKSNKPQKPPPPRPIPPSQATQQLIHSIADQLDATSNNLLRQIPATRTPSPVSMRDFQSPSPTPDGGFGDFIDNAENEMQNQNQENFFGIEMDNGLNDNPFADPPVPIAPAPAPAPVEQPKPEVHRAPPRPKPPRPAPPKSSLASSPVTAPTPVQPTITSTNTVAPQQQQDDDLFDFFGVQPKAAPPKPPAPKSKEDILSLFSTPAPTATTTVVTNQQTDLLSGDFDDIMGSSDFVPNLADNMTIMSHTVHAEPPPPPPPSVQMQETIVEPSPEIVLELETPPVINIEDNLYKSEVSSDYSPAGSNFTSGNIPSSVSGSILNVAMEENVEEAEKDAANIPEQFEEDFPAPIEEDFPAPEAQQYEEQYQEPIFSQPEVQQYVEPQSQDLDFSVPELDAVNPFAIPDLQPELEPEPYQTMMDIQQTVPEAVVTNNYANELFGTAPSVNNNIPAEVLGNFPVKQKEPDAFDAFAAKFEGKQGKATNVFLDEPIVNNNIDAFGGGGAGGGGVADAWGDASPGGFDDMGADDGFGNEGGFDPFLSMTTPAVAEKSKLQRDDSKDSDEAKEFSVFIRPKEGMEPGYMVPNLAPPPKSPQTASIYSGDSSPRFNPFDKTFGDEADTVPAVPDSLNLESAKLERTDSQETPQTPLFDDDVSQPLEDFPRVNYSGDGWEMQLRQPNKKKITGQRFWKKIFIRLVLQGDNPVLQLFNAQGDKEPFQELPLQACYSVSEIGAQQFDNFGKIFTIKLQYVFYKERPGVRPGQVTKAERLTNKLSQFAAYAIQGDYQGVKELGSDLKKLGLPVEHAPQISQLFKLGSMSFEDMKQFSMCIEEALFKLNVHRDRALTYKTEEVQITAVDELYVEQDAEGHVLKQIARVRLFFLAFLSGMPDIELGVNDLWRQGKEVVGRHDIIPVVTEEWIRLEGVEFHGCVQQDEYEKCRIIKFKPPDACYIELMRFRIRPPKNRELPLQLKATWCVTGNKVELRADVLVPGFASRKLGQIPCEDVAIRFPIPECWIYLFRVEKHFRYGSVKSAHRRTGKIKGIERFLGTVETLQESLIEVTSGQAKYEHNHRAIVWRCPRLPKEGQGAYTTHQLVCRMALTSFDQIPEQLAPYAYIEFSMPATQASHTTVRSVSVQESDSDEPPEKYVRYLARHEYRVGIEHTQGEGPNAYLAATMVRKAPEPIREEQPMATTPIAPSDSDSDSN